MAWKKASPELIDLFASVIPRDPRIESRQMFGFPCCFVGGNMFAGLHEDNLVLRLDEPTRAELVAAGGAPFVPMPGRAMKEYVAVPHSFYRQPDALRSWLERALAYGLSLPKKAAKAKVAKVGKARSKAKATAR